MTRLQGHFIKKVPTIRKISMGAWSKPSDPSVYASINLEMTAIVAFVSQQKKEGHSIKAYHVVLAALSNTLEKYPQLNRCRIRGRIFQRDIVRVFIPVSLKSRDGEDLLGVAIDNAHHKAIPDLVNEITEKVSNLRFGRDKPMKRVQAIIGLWPQRLSGLLIGLLNTIFHRLNLNIIGLPKDRFGSVILSDLSALGFDSAFIPLFPFSRTSLSLSLGQARTDETGTQQTLSVTADHRIFDGWIAAKAKKHFTKLIEHPEKIFINQPS